MKQITVDIPVGKQSTFDNLLKENLEPYLRFEDKTIFTSRDITTDEYEIIKVAERLCRMNEVQGLIL